MRTEHGLNDTMLESEGPLHYFGKPPGRRGIGTGAIPQERSDEDQATGPYSPRLGRNRTSSISTGDLLKQISMGPVLCGLTMQRTYKCSPDIEPGDYTHERGSVIEYTKFGGKTVKNEWQKMTQKNGGSPVWVLVKDIKETRDGKPVERKRYNDWNRYFTEIDVSKAGKYKLPSLTADQFKKVGLSENEGNTLEQMAIHSVSQSVTGCPMPFGSIVQSYSPARERWAYCYYKAVTEWKKDDDYTDALCSSDRVMRKRIEKLREGLCFWDDAKNAGAPHFPESDENWYFHPQRFIDHLNKVITPAEFNPYEGMTFSMRTTDDTYGNGEWKTTKVEDSPGFAPVVGYATNYEYNGQYYAPISGLFNQDYSRLAYYASQGKQMVHEGLDLPAAEGTVIHSLIHGLVLAYGWLNSGYGYIMIIKETGKNKLYFLAHLKPDSQMVEEGEYVVPGQPVARVGGSGRNKNPAAWDPGFHLHLEVWESPFSQKKYIFEEDSWNGEYLQFVDKDFSAEKRSGIRRDPFKHDDVYTP